MTRTLIAALALATVTAAPATAGTYTLGFGSLPSAQGWTYLTQGGGAGIPDSNLYTATGSSLTQNTMGIPMTSGGHNYYLRPVTITAGADFSLKVRARVSAFEGLAFGGGTNYPFGMFFTVGTTTGYSIMGISGSRFGYLDAAGAVAYGDYAPGFDITAFNDYAITRTAGLTRLSVNGTTLASFVATPLGGDSLEFGDGTGFGNAAGEYSSLVFRSGAVPEPASWAMLVTGFGIVGGTLRSRRRAMVTAG